MRALFFFLEQTTSTGQSFHRMPAIPVDVQRQNLLVSNVRDAVGRGEIELGERICREMHAAGWGNGRTWLVIAEVARRVGRRDIALDAVTHAQAAGGAGAEEINAARAAAESMPERAGVPGGVHVIRSWGQGFWSDVDHVIGQLAVAEMTGRTPIVLWGANTRFGDGTTNAWEHYFEPVSQAQIPTGASFFPSKWRADNLTVAENGAFTGPGSRIAFLPFLSSDATLTVSDFHAPLIAVSHWIRASSMLSGKSLQEMYPALLSAHVRVRGDIVARADTAAAELGLGQGGAPVISVHVRGSDKVIEMGDMRPVHAAYHSEVDRRLEALGKDTRVLLLTDWQPAADQFRTRYGSRMIETAALRTAGTVGLHFHDNRDGLKLGREVLIDALLAARANALVGLGWSNVSLYMAYLAKIRGMHDENISLLGPNLHFNYNWPLLRKS